MTEEELDRIWADCKAREEREEAEWNALPEEEKNGDVRCTTLVF